jgi:pimeloyl-ACP methyl ester carboxylesterase
VTCIETSATQAFRHRSKLAVDPQLKISRVAIPASGPRLPDSLIVNPIEHIQPTFIANGDHDAMVPTEKSFELLRRIPNSILSIYPDGGHAGVSQFHEVFLPQALDFLRR